MVALRQMDGQHRYEQGEVPAELPIDSYRGLLHAPLATRKKSRRAFGASSRTREGMDTPSGLLTACVIPRIRSFWESGLPEPASSSNSHPLEALNPIWDGQKNEIKFARGRRNQKWNYQAQPTLIVGFEEVEIAGRHTPAINVLDAAVGQVKRVLLETEEECRRLGFIS
jgi:hypothetical protein